MAAIAFKRWHANCWQPAPMVRSAQVCDALLLIWCDLEWAGIDFREYRWRCAGIVYDTAVVRVQPRSRTVLIRARAK